jgi:hypothetical protein
MWCCRALAGGGRRGARDFLRFGPFGLVVEAPVILLTCRLIGNRPFCPSGRRSIVMITPCIAPRGERSLYTRAVGYSYDASISRLVPTRRQRARRCKRPSSVVTGCARCCRACSGACNDLIIMRRETEPKRRTGFNEIRVRKPGGTPRDGRNRLGRPACRLPLERLPIINQFFAVFCHAASHQIVQSPSSNRSHVGK